MIDEEHVIRARFGNRCFGFYENPSGIWLYIIYTASYNCMRQYTEKDLMHRLILIEPMQMWNNRIVDAASLSSLFGSYWF